MNKEHESERHSSSDSKDGTSIEKESSTDNKEASNEKIGN